MSIPRVCVLSQHEMSCGSCRLCQKDATERYRVTDKPSTATNCAAQFVQQLCVEAAEDWQTGGRGDGWTGSELERRTATSAIGVIASKPPYSRGLLSVRSKSGLVHPPHDRTGLRESPLGERTFAREWDSSRFQARTHAEASIDLAIQTTLSVA